MDDSNVEPNILIGKSLLFSHINSGLIPTNNIIISDSISRNTDLFNAIAESYNLSTDNLNSNSLILNSVTFDSFSFVHYDETDYIYVSKICTKTIKKIEDLVNSPEWKEKSNKWLFDPDDALIPASYFIISGDFREDIKGYYVHPDLILEVLKHFDVGGEYKTQL
jgi:hypothetical protein